MTLDEWGKLSSCVRSLFTVLAIVVGGIFGLCEYFSAKQASKVGNTLNLVDEYYSPPMVKVFRDISSSWDIGYGVLSTIVKNAENPAEEYSTFVKALIKEESLQYNIERLFRFYERVVICVESQVCDAKSARAFFLRDGKTFFRQYYPYVCGMRSRWNDPTIWASVQMYFNPESINKVCS